MRRQSASRNLQWHDRKKDGSYREIRKARRRGESVLDPGIGWGLPACKLAELFAASTPVRTPALLDLQTLPER
jgi:hypothetical protein